jgi:long-chain fatty acid transport protein
LLVDLSWTEWTSFRELAVYRANGSLLTYTPHNWKNVWRVGVGVNYHCNDEWIVRAGIAYDNTPVSAEYRTPRIPDSDRFWIAFGAQYKVNKAGAIDFGFAHVFMKNSTMSLPGPGYAANTALSSGTLLGNYSANVNMLAVQYSHGF